MTTIGAEIIIKVLCDYVYVNILANISEGTNSFDRFALGCRTFSFLTSFQVPKSDNQAARQFTLTKYFCI